MEIKGDFLGFSFADVRSESLGIVRTSDGDRYSEELQPEIRDITVEVPGMNGNYYFGSTYGPRELSISFAFDSMTEEQFRKMRATFSKGKIGELIFDERPYKAYMAKIATPIELKYICFDEAARTEGGVQEGKGLRVIDRTTTKTSTVSDASEGLTVTLDETTYRTFFPNDGTNTFIYRNSVWYLIEEEAEVVLENYGINATIYGQERCRQVNPPQTYPRRSFPDIGDHHKNKRGEDRVPPPADGARQGQDGDGGDDESLRLSVFPPCQNRRNNVSAI